MGNQWSSTMRNGEHVKHHREWCNRACAVEAKCFRCYEMKGKDMEQERKLCRYVWSDMSTDPMTERLCVLPEGHASVCMAMDPTMLLPVNATTRCGHAPRRDIVLDRIEVTEERVRVLDRIASTQLGFNSRTHERLEALEAMAHEPVDVRAESRNANDARFAELERSVERVERTERIVNISNVAEALEKAEFELNVTNEQLNEFKGACAKQELSLMLLEKQLDDMREQKHQGDVRILELERDQNRRIDGWRHKNVRDAVNLLNRQMLGNAGPVDPRHEVVALLMEATRGFSAGDLVPVPPKEMAALTQAAYEKGVNAMLAFTCGIINSHIEPCDYGDAASFDERGFTSAVRERFFPTVTIAHASKPEDNGTFRIKAKPMVERVRDALQPMFSAHPNKIGVLHIEEVQHPSHQVVVVCTLRREPDPSNSFGHMLTEAARPYMPQDVTVQVTVNYQHEVKS